MNNAKMWLVVSPTIGVPIFLGAVAVGSFAVHLQVVKNTSWVSDYLQGVPMGTGDAMASAAVLQQSELEAARASYVMPTGDGVEVTVILPDGTNTQAILRLPETLAANDAGQAALITQ
jgi:light-harvesting protein B-800-850 alpha chain